MTGDAWFALAKPGTARLVGCYGVAAGARQEVGARVSVNNGTVNRNGEHGTIRRFDLARRRAIVTTLDVAGVVGLGDSPTTQNVLGVALRVAAVVRAQVAVVALLAALDNAIATHRVVVARPCCAAHREGGNQRQQRETRHCPSKEQAAFPIDHP